MILKLGMQHQGLKLDEVSINYDPVVTLTYLSTWSNLFAYMFYLETVTKSFNGENLQQVSELTE